MTKVKVTNKSKIHVPSLTSTPIIIWYKWKGIANVTQVENEGQRI